MDSSDIKKGLKMLWDGQPYAVVEFQFVKPGKGQAFTRTKMKNLLTGNMLERNIRSGERFDPADVEEKSMQYIYPEGENFVFMNAESGEQVSVGVEAVGDAKNFLIDGLEVSILIYNGNPINISLPPHVIVEIVTADPGLKGDTASNVTKPATIATGASINVPLFINEGDWVRVDTRTGDYQERVKNPNA